MNIVFAGTPEFSAFHLSLLLNSNHQISLILTQPDRRSGRGKLLKRSLVKELGEKNNISVLQPYTLKNNVELFSRLRRENPDLLLVVAYGLIIPKEILKIPRFGCINIHASLLPKWRGAAPIERCILEGDKKSGITFMKMEEGLDTGPILKKVTCTVDKKETYDSLMFKLQEISSGEMIKFLKDLSLGNILETKQNSSLATYAQKFKPEESKINWMDFSAEYIERKIRSLPQRNAPFTYLHNARIKILQALVDTVSFSTKPGQILIRKNKEIHVGCKKGTSIEIKSIQLEGKKIMSANEFIKGNKEKLLKNKKFSSQAYEN